LQTPDRRPEVSDRSMEGVQMKGKEVGATW